MKFGVIVFPGSNCDEDLYYVLKEQLKQDTVKLWHKDKDLQGVDFVFVPGGFSYGDYLRSGAIARFSPVMESVVEHANKGGYVMGICNGFQVLTEAGLLPGVLLRNDNRKFNCKNLYIRKGTSNTLLTKGVEDKALKIPIAHADGRFYAPDDMMKEILDQDQVIFRYCDENGQITSESNPNGSLHNIAGVCNKGRNVFGMMPHPERAASEILGNTDGLALFESILQLAF